MEKKKNTAASVRARLKNKSLEKNTEFQTLLIRFGNERLLYRLSQSAYKTSFLLKRRGTFRHLDGRAAPPDERYGFAWAWRK